MLKKNLLLILIILIATLLISQEEINWLKNNNLEIKNIYPNKGLSDMDKAFDDIIGNADIVGLGESGHAIKNIAIFRIRLLEYLVKRKGFKAIALESGFYEGQLVNRYIHGLEKDIIKTLTKGFTHNMGLWEESKALLEWMKDYNLKKSPEDKIYFYGMDLHNYQDVIISRTKEEDSPLEQVMNFMKKVDLEYYENHGKKLIALAQISSKTVDDVADFFEKIKGKRYIDPDFLDELCTISYRNLNDLERKELSYLLEYLINLMEIRRLRYISQKNITKDEYEFALQLAKFCQNIIGNLEFRESNFNSPNIDKIKIYLQKYIYKNSPETLKKLRLNEIQFDNNHEGWIRYFEARNGRERTMSENLDWIVKKHKKVLIFAHNSHLSKVEYISPNPLHKNKYGYGLGQYISSKYGNKYIIISQTMDYFVDKSNKIIEKYKNIPIMKTEECKDCIENILKKSTYNNYVIDIREKNLKQYPKIKSWLNKELNGRFGFEFYKVNHFKAFDAIVFIREMQFGKNLK